MITGWSGRILLGKLKSLECLAICLLVLSFSLVPSFAYGSWNNVDEILREAYGAQAARECQDFYGALAVPDSQVGSIAEAIGRLVEAGYPSGCPKEYLRLAAQLSGAGIQLNDLTNKIREGIAKKVSPERLTAVITHRVEALLDARVLTLELIEDGTEFMDRQMTYTVMADYLLRGVKSEELRTDVSEGNMKRFPALANLIR